MRTPPLRWSWRLTRVLVVLLLPLLSQPPARAADEVVTDCSNDSQLGSKLLAIQNAGGGTLTFSCGAGSHTIILSGALPAIVRPTTIDGGGRITISGGNTRSILWVAGGGALTLNNLTLSNGLNTPGDGGAIVQSANSTLNINNSRFINNQSGLSGGAIVSYGELNIANSEFVGNRAVNGGAIYPRHGAIVMITGSSFRENEAGTTGIGGAMLLWDGPRVTIRGSTLSANKAANGGAIYVTERSSLAVDQASTLSGNEATDNHGGAVYNAGTVTLTGVTLIGNRSWSNGGGLYNAGTATVSGVTLNANQASPRGSGGGIHNSGTATVSDSTLSANRARFGGGGIFNNGTLAVLRTTLSGNSTLDSDGVGGGLSNPGTATLTNVTLSSNAANRYGGGIYNSGTATIANATLSANAAPNGGGGIYHATSAAGRSLTFRNTILASNASGGNCAQATASATSIASAGFNLSSDFTCTSYFNQTGDLNNRNPLLGPLASNGGPTQTHRPLPGSPAIDGGTSTGAPTTDQRGVSRPQRAAFDIGAVEVRELDHMVYLPMTIR